MANLLTVTSASLGTDGVTLIVTIGGTVVLPLTYTTGFSISSRAIGAPAENHFFPASSVVAGSSVVLTLPTALPEGTTYELYYTPGNLTDSAGSTMAGFTDSVISVILPAPLYTVKPAITPVTVPLGAYMPVSAQFSAFDLQTGAASSFTAAQCAMTLYSAVLHTAITGYADIGANILGSPGTVITCEAQINSDVNIPIPTPLVAGTYTAQFTLEDTNGLEYIASVPVAVVDLK